MNAGDAVALALLILCILSLSAVALWWNLWGKAAHYRRVMDWSEAANYRHHEYKDAKAYFRKHRRST